MFNFVIVIITIVSDQECVRLDFVKFLPYELLENIFSKLAPRDLAAAALVSTHWRAAVNSNIIWHRICNRRGWSENLDPAKSLFAKAHKQFRLRIDPKPTLTVLCPNQILFNKHSYILKHWSSGTYVCHRLPNNFDPQLSIHFQLYEPFVCNGKLLVTALNLIDGQETSLAVWDVIGVPFYLYKLSLPSSVRPLDALTFEYDTVVAAQDWVVIVFRVEGQNMTKAFEKNELHQLAPVNRQRMTPYLKVTMDFIVCVPNCAHSSSLTIYFWNRVSGDLTHQLNLDSMYYEITSAVWFGESCYLAVTHKKMNKHKVIEFGTRTAAWEFFEQHVQESIEEIAVCNQYVLVASRTRADANRSDYDWVIRSDRNIRQVTLWDRSSSAFVKKFTCQGRSYQFLNDHHIMYFNGAVLTIVNAEDTSIKNEILANGMISSISICPHTNLLLIRTSTSIEVWNSKLGMRLYIIPADTGVGSQLWCTNRFIITCCRFAEQRLRNGIMLIGFW